ncbi:PATHOGENESIS-RELATED THAUMATIN SUPERFAMILY PROTEIN [Salix purpurea]|uniref:PATHOGENESIS-RELATED THAUMATIN SUPERFAMILY PROTEIN n=1 Tax=Salix purpurea TaxID=77065 RepID=A0A9Q1AKD7_SALPP|nr:PATHOGENESIS-RELATED THAUMATIN SUPERFAMILY PROTEIN [Salix purpurea]KAJ6774646.1 PATHOGENESIS-RELATED THAUMATIN SUPERFAMILY PROTEIN [Salix purpurea]
MILILYCSLSLYIRRQRSPWTNQTLQTSRFPPFKNKRRTSLNSQIYSSMASPRLYISLSLFSFLLIASGGYSSTFTIINKCNHLVWPGILSNAGTAQLPTTGFVLQPGESNSISFPQSWSGRLWGRTLCTQDPTTGIFSCLTGDCGSSTLECSGRGAAPPATLAELTLNGADGLDFYDVSLVDGYNLPMLIAPQSGTGGNCTTTGCVVDLNSACPNELKVIDSGNGENLACRSACEAFGDAEYCCSGAYATPDTCKPSSYAQFFKNACPRAYSYAYDDGTSTFTCAGADYVITFCPAPTTSQKSANGLQNSLSASVSAGEHNTSPYFIGALITIAVAIWQLF